MNFFKVINLNKNEPEKYLKLLRKLIKWGLKKSAKLKTDLLHNINIRSFHIIAEVQAAKCSKYQSNRMLKNANAPTLQVPTEWHYLANSVSVKSMVLIHTALCNKSKQLILVKKLKQKNLTEIIFLKHRWW